MKITMTVGTRITMYGHNYQVENIEDNEYTGSYFVTLRKIPEKKHRRTILMIIEREV